MARIPRGQGLVLRFVLIGTCIYLAHPHPFFFPPKTAIYIFGRDVPNLLCLAMIVLLTIFAFFLLLYWEEREGCFLKYALISMFLIFVTLVYQSSNDQGYFTEEGMYLKSLGNVFLPQKISWEEMEQSPVVFEIDSITSYRNGSLVYEFKVMGTVVRANPPRKEDGGDFFKIINLMVEKNVNITVKIRPRSNTPDSKKSEIAGSALILLKELMQASLARDKEDAALYYISRAIELNDGDAWLYEERGGIYLYLGNIDQAAADFKKAAEKNPRSIRAYMGFGMIEALQGNNRTAISNMKYARLNDKENKIAAEELLIEALEAELVEDKGRALILYHKFISAIGTNEEGIDTYWKNEVRFAQQKISLLM